MILIRSRESSGQTTETRFIHRS